MAASMRQGGFGCQTDSYGELCFQIDSDSYYPNGSIHISVDSSSYPYGFGLTKTNHI